MKTPPFNVNHLYFIGIGGIGMSAIAEIMHHMGYTISGSNLGENANVKRLKKLGVPIHTNHDKANIHDDIDVVVISSAVPETNIEVEVAREKHIPVVRRAEMLSELMKLKSAISVAGSHGKTTTTSLLSHALEESGQDPTIVNGGILMAHNSNARLGSSQWMVVEADESDGSFQELPSTIGIITNIDYEHMDYYGSKEKLHQAFANFIARLPFYGFAVVNIDMPAAKELVGEFTKRRIITYGVDDEAHVTARNIRALKEGMQFDVHIKSVYPVKHFVNRDTHIKDVFIPLCGEHNVINALSVVIVMLELGVGAHDISRMLENFRGVGRRFNVLGETGSGGSIIDDYAHHPTEILATLKAARMREPHNKLVAIIQPHRYSRVKEHFDEFVAAAKLADEVYFMPIYPAGETPIEGVTSERLAEAVKSKGLHAEVLQEPNLVNMLRQPGAETSLLFMGAGSISGLLYEALESLRVKTA